MNKISRNAFLGVINTSLLAFTMGCSDDNGDATSSEDGAGGGGGEAEAPLTAEQIELVQTSWASVEPIQETASQIFYDKLLEDDEEMQALFSETDFDIQRFKLMETLGVAVAGLTDLESLVPVLEALGERHVAYGVKFEHFAKVGAALLATLAEGLGDDFTKPVEEAWAAVYGVVSGTMIQAGGFEPES